MITVYSKEFCPYCIRLLELLQETDITYHVIDVIKEDKQDEMMGLSGERGVPQVHIGEIIIPDYNTEETLISDIAWLQQNPDVQIDEIHKNTTSKIISTSC